LCTTVVHNTAQNSSDIVLSYSPDNHRLDAVYWKGGEGRAKEGRGGETMATEQLLLLQYKLVPANGSDDLN